MTTQYGPAVTPPHQIPSEGLSSNSRQILHLLKMNFEPLQLLDPGHRRRPITSTRQPMDIDIPCLVLDSMLVPVMCRLHIPSATGRRL